MTAKKNLYTPMYDFSQLWFRFQIHIFSEPDEVSSEIETFAVKHSCFLSLSSYFYLMKFQHITLKL